MVGVSRMKVASPASHHVYLIIVCIVDDPNVAAYVARRVSKGFPPIQHGSLYDIISIICDHEFAEMIVNKLRKHTETHEVPAPEEVPAPNHGANAKETPRPRQSLGDYYISNQPHISPEDHGNNFPESECQDPHGNHPKEPQKKHPKQHEKVMCVSLVLGVSLRVPCVSCGRCCV